MNDDPRAPPPSSSKPRRRLRKQRDLFEPVTAAGQAGAKGRPASKLSYDPHDRRQLQMFPEPAAKQ